MNKNGLGGKPMTSTHIILLAEIGMLQKITIYSVSGNKPIMFQNWDGCITVKCLSWSDIRAVHTELKTEGTLSEWSNVTGQNESAGTEINVIHIFCHGVNDTPSLHSLLKTNYKK